MPLYIEPIPERWPVGKLLAWLLEGGTVKKQQVGAIDFRGRRAVVEVPETVGSRLARELEEKPVKGRAVQVWYGSEETDGDIDGHLQRLDRWLDLEARAASEQFKERTDDASAGLSNLIIREEDTGLGGYTLLALGLKNPMQPLPVVQLNVGSPVQLASEQDRRRGVVTRLDSHVIEVALSKPFPGQDDKPVLRLTPADDEIGMQRAKTALARARYARDDRTADIRDTLMGRREPRFESVSDLEFFRSDLNDSQRDAIGFALSARDLAVIHGPPGTGKTTTLVELIRQAIRRGEKVLACAPSNLGVDNLFERLLAGGEKAIRLGHPVRVLPHLRDRTLKAMVREHAAIKQARKLRREANDLFRKADRSARADVDRDGLRTEARELLADARGCEADAIQETIDDANVVCATNTGIDADLLGHRRFDLLVIDEACQTTEPACWIPILRANRVILAGDHCQLPPTILSQAAAREGFSVSLQERLVESYGETISRPLLVQHRMHEDIMMFSSNEFYQNRLEAHPTVAGHRLCDLSGVEEEEL
ncbi:MAG: AAA domain-containing protein, partial [Verrucomicrobiota bacterium]